MLIKQYEKAVASWQEKELKADDDTTNTTPVLQITSAMEKQAANLYTRRIFMKFQEELVEILANLAVFRAENVLKLPSQYVLKRWTRYAKTGTAMNGRASDLPNNTRGSSTIKYNKLCQEAIKYVEVGAKSIPSYNVAMDALREAASRVTAAKNQGSGPTHGSTLSDGARQELHGTEGTQAQTYQSAVCFSYLATSII
ncbi:hypothetical protein JRO89_XS02G0001000 [Xanthoceras sorbifolium]|uniref:Protein FAR1-RELATED SEQUENCE n=1 Tax=Xanthoceras sorbifolium TaxID=99658 RepID=A0ABQ8IDN3_9ROSI|nr:hypothetical protein JRO89_XS02G0001000 [Xanthoceras sorbifolium]